MSEKTHVIHYIGGPADMTKRAFLGERPERGWVVHIELSAAAEWAESPRDVACMTTVKHEYRLIPLPNISGRPERVFAAVYGGRLS